MAYKGDGQALIPDGGQHHLDRLAALPLQARLSQDKLMVGENYLSLPEINPQPTSSGLLSY
jgi:hypothetical protein